MHGKLNSVNKQFKKQINDFNIFTQASMKISFEIIPTTSKGTRTTEPNNSEQKLTIVNPGIKPNMAAVKTTQFQN